MSNERACMQYTISIGSQYQRVEAFFPVLVDYVIGVYVAVRPMSLIYIFLV